MWTNKPNYLLCIFFIYLGLTNNFGVTNAMAFGQKSLSGEWAERFSDVKKLNSYATTHIVKLSNVKIENYDIGESILPKLELENTYWENVKIKQSTILNGNIYGDGTISHNKTGLMWKQCSEGLSTTVTPCDTGVAIKNAWFQALQLSVKSNFAMYGDWRLPN